MENGVVVMEIEKSETNLIVKMYNYVSGVYMFDLSFAITP
jgi:hypothetical protein